MRVYGCELRFDSFLHVPTASDELRSDPENSDSTPGPGPPAAGRDAGEGRATAAVQSDGNDGSASSVPAGESGDELASLGSWR